MEHDNLIEGSIDKRYACIVHQNKVQKYGMFDTVKDAEHWWMEHKTPFFETDRPPNWGFGFVATYDTINKKVIEYNKLWLNEEIVNDCINEFIQWHKTNR